MTAHNRNHSETFPNSSALSGIHAANAIEGDETLGREARRVLRRLSETGAVLALAADMDKAVVLRTLKDGPPTRTAVVSRDVAQAFALKNWITCSRTGRVSSYTITAAGRVALKQYLSEDLAHKRRMRGAQDGRDPFVDGQSDWVNRMTRPMTSESPLAMLARRRDKEGRAFLSAELVQAGERFREDYELSQMGHGAAQNWDRFMCTGDKAEWAGEEGVAEGSKDARTRMIAALDDLGPGLSDIIMRCCCFLEGLETAEKRMGWSARSGKIVLRIALQRLHAHYVEQTGHVSAMIG
ncbi:MAG: DUF6456 domain-containing protein [Litoreibacter sp.]|uniref:DUF6456 domain-containing protein n=1 Tax=Litoreibacter sp. TaxID=1969459 RepID=UPI003298CD5F